MSYATGINASGEVVGYSRLSGNTISHAFLYSGGQMTDLGSLGGANSGSDASAVNDSGEIVGATAIPNSSGNAFAYLNGDMSAIPPPGGGFSQANAINSSGQIVGALLSVGSTSGAPFPFLYSDGTFTMLGKTQGSANGINDSGEVVGSNNFDQAFLYSNGVTSELPNLTGANGASEAHAINNAGQIAGSSYPAGGGGRHACLFYDGTITDIGVLGGTDENTESDAYGINNSGQMVGFSTVAGGGGVHAFIYSNGMMTDLNSLIPANSGWTISFAYDINDSGDIVGYGINPAGATHGFLLTPMPEPSSFGCFLFLAVGMALRPASLRQESRSVSPR